MKLYQNPLSIECRKVLATAYHLDLPLKIQTIDYRSDDLESAEFRKKNPNGMLPLLEDGSFYLWESNAIMQYLADKKGASDLYPADARTRADISRWQYWTLAHFGNACNALQFENLIKPRMQLGDPDRRLVTMVSADLQLIAGVLDRHLDGRDYIVGDAVTLADYAAASHLTFAEAAKLPLGRFRNITAWYERIEGLEPWKKSTPKV